MQTATPDVSTKLNDALGAVQDMLLPFLQTPEATTVLTTLFGAEANLGALDTLIDALESGNLASLLTVELVPGETLASTIAAYVDSAATVYLAQEFLAEAIPDALVATLMQQVGHLVDSLVNTGDTMGNEGALFEALVMGHELSPEVLSNLQTTNNLQEITVQDATVLAEVSVMPPYPMDMNSPQGTITMEPMQGGRGRDRFRGDAGADDMAGGRGRDILRGEGGDDKMDGGAGRDRMAGGAGNDEMYGGGGRDRMKGGEGDDLMYGGAGRDRMKGGDGADTFGYEKMKDRGDLILDFDVAADALDLSSVLAELGYENLSFSALLDDVIVLGQSKRGARVGIDADGADGEARAKTFAVLKGVDAEDLTSSNFIVQEAVM